MDVTELQAIGDTLMRIVTPDITPRQLIRAARKEHPNAYRPRGILSIIANAD
ncbi:hypothetical protein NKH69_20635 [Mesorhizobium sp. M0976]|uniref:hypothetical protein n=1 Tax=Mesorhizobium sp. M0976 TaxID=2957038 RepID=UPI00333BFB41